MLLNLGACPEVTQVCAESLVNNCEDRKPPVRALEGTRRDAERRWRGPGPALGSNRGCCFT